MNKDGVFCKKLHMPSCLVLNANTNIVKPILKIYLEPDKEHKIGVIIWQQHFVLQRDALPKIVNGD